MFLQMDCFCVENLRFSLVEVLGVSANGLFLCGNNWAVFVWKNLGFLWLRSWVFLHVCS